MPVPKKKLTKRRIGNRRSQAHGKIDMVPQLAKCAVTGKLTMPHRVSAAGYYKGKQIIAKLV